MEKCMQCDECVKTAKAFGKENLLTVDTEPEKFKFTVESTGALPPEVIVSEALRILSSKIQVCHDAITNLRI